MSVSNATHAATVKHARQLANTTTDLTKTLAETRAQLAAAQARLRADPPDQNYDAAIRSFITEVNALVAVTTDRDQAQATIARIAALADEWDNDADSWDGPPNVPAATAAHAYATDLRAALETSTTATETTT